MMDQLIARFTGQLEEAMEIGRNANIRKPVNPIEHIYVAGLGGSGIGADFVSAFIKNECKIPFLVGKGYQVPAYVGPHTLAIASSYSGNTEETLISYEQLKSQGAHIICVASGGKLIEKATADGYDYIRVPSDWPSPRACLGYSVLAQLWILNHLGIISESAIHSVQSSISMLRTHTDEIKSEAEAIAKRLHGKLPIIYIEDRMEPVAVRLRQQINENSKALCWHHVIPEMNHNELVGWRDRNENLAVLWLRNDDDYPRNALRMDINNTIISQYTDEIIEVRSKGADRIEKAFYLVHLGDWISWYLAQLRSVDALEVRVIDFLKGELSKVN